MTDDGAVQEQLDAWQAVAEGWERNRDVVWTATHAVSERLVELLAPAPGESVVEVAAGPGDTGFLAAPALLPGGRLLSTDGVAGMVEAAQRRAAELSIPNVEFAIADAASLPFDDGTFDGALCRFGVMLVPDCDTAAAELGRVLRPGGRAAVAVWAEGERNLWMTAAGRAALRLGLTEPPDPEAPGPFRLSAPGRLRSVLERGRLEVVVEEEVDVLWRASSLEHWWEIMLDTSRTLALLTAKLSPDDVERIRRGAEERLAGFVAQDGTVAVPGVARVALANRRT
jgi:SAM-dependent methyltransferase